MSTSDDREREAEEIDRALARGEDGPLPEDYTVIEAGPLDQMREDLMTILLEDAEGRAVA